MPGTTLSGMQIDIDGKCSLSASTSPVPRARWYLDPDPIAMAIA